MAAARAPPAPGAPPAAPVGGPKRKTKNQKTLSKVKARFSFVAGIAGGSASAVAPGSTAESVGWWQGVKNAKRRISQQALSTIGYGKDTEDEHYKERKARILELQGRYERFSKFLGQYMDSARAMCSAAAELSEEAQNLFAGAPPEYTAVLSTMCASLNRIDTNLRQELDEVLCEQVIGPIDAVVDVMNEVRVDMHGREYLKLDFDAHRRRVTGLKAKAGTDPAEVAKADRKLTADKEALAVATKNLYDAFDDLEAKRWSVITGELNAFTAAQSAFFKGGAELTAGVTHFPPAMPRATVPLTRASSTPFGPVTLKGHLPGFPHLYGEAPESDPSTRAPPPAEAVAPRKHRATLPPTTTAALTGGPGDPTGGGGLSPAVAVAAAAAQRRRSSVGDDPRHAAAAKAAVAAASRKAPPPVPAADQVRAVFKFDPSSPDELGLAVGDIVDVSARHDDGWADGENSTTGQRGLFPLNYVEKV